MAPRSNKMNANFPADSSLRQPLRIQQFVPPPGITHPCELFFPVSTPSGKPPRFVNHCDPKEFLMYATGCAIYNGLSDVTGCAFVYGTPSPQHGSGMFGFKMERTGPYMMDWYQTQDRGELRAVIAALMYRWWWQEGYQRLVIATDSTYVVEGITRYQNCWSAEGWVKSKHEMITNSDLWDVLVYVLGSFQRLGLHVRFWLVLEGPRGEGDYLEQALGWASTIGADANPPKLIFDIFQDPSLQPCNKA